MFKKQNKIEYIDGQIVANITQIIDLRVNLDETQYYFIADYKSPEQISYELYNNPNYHWTILLLNNIIDPYHDWPMSNENLLNYSLNKYLNINATHHYVDANGFIVDELISHDYDTGTPIPSEIVIVSNYDYEASLNDKKRDIIVIKPKNIKNFVNAYERIQESLV